jgi:hypothetical protein
LKDFIPCLLTTLRDIDLRVKYHAERCLKHLCEGITITEAMNGCKPGNNALVLQYLNNSNSSSQEKEHINMLRDYMRRILPTLSVDSENEGYD